MAENSILDKWKNPGGSSTPAAPKQEKQAEILPGPGREEYKAYKAVDLRQLRLHIRGKGNLWAYGSYAYLPAILEQGDTGTFFSMNFSNTMVVEVVGRNLQQVARAIADEKCDMIQVFDAGKFLAASDPKAPFIEEIRILTSRPDDEAPK